MRHAAARDSAPAECSRPQFVLASMLAQPNGCLAGRRCAAPHQPRATRRPGSGRRGAAPRPADGAGPAPGPRPRATRAPRRPTAYRCASRIASATKATSVVPAAGFSLGGDVRTPLCRQPGRHRARRAPSTSSTIASRRTSSARRRTRRARRRCSRDRTLSQTSFALLQTIGWRAPDCACSPPSARASRSATSSSPEIDLRPGSKTAAQPLARGVRRRRAGAVPHDRASSCASITPTPSPTDLRRHRRDELFAVRRPLRRGRRPARPLLRWPAGSSPSCCWSRRPSGWRRSASRSSPPRRPARARPVSARPPTSRSGRSSASCWAPRWAWLVVRVGVARVLRAAPGAVRDRADRDRRGVRSRRRRARRRRQPLAAPRTAVGQPGAVPDRRHRPAGGGVGRRPRRRRRAARGGIASRPLALALALLAVLVLVAAARFLGGRRRARA